MCIIRAGVRMRCRILLLIFILSIILFNRFLLKNQVTKSVKTAPISELEKYIVQ